MMAYAFITSWRLLTVIVDWIYESRKAAVLVGIMGCLAQAAMRCGFWYYGMAALAVVTALGMYAAPDIFLRGKL